MFLLVVVVSENFVKELLFIGVLLNGLLLVFVFVLGLLEGFYEVGVVEFCWVIEKEEFVVSVFSLNNFGCIVFIDDCNFLLKFVMDVS